MKKILLLATVFAFVGSTYAYNGGGKDKEKKAKANKECVKGAEKKSCCASKQSCKKPETSATTPDTKAK